MAKRRVGWYPKEFRRIAVERLRTCDNIVALSRELGVHRRRLTKPVSLARFMAPASPYFVLN